MEIGSQSAGVIINSKDKLENLFEEIGVDICQITEIYPNAGLWNISTLYRETFQGKTVYEALKKYQQFLK